MFRLISYVSVFAAGWYMARLSDVPRSARQVRQPLPVRDAGRSQMRDPPKQWDAQDEIVDESFPASDPPAQY